MANLHFHILQIIIFYALFSFCGTYFTAYSIPPSISTDKEALLSFKSQLTVQSPNPLSTWDSNSSPCNWTGVSCRKNDQRVVGLDLSGLRLTGSITPHIGNLSFLRSLQLQNNQLTGPIPDQIGNLFRLRILNMSSNIIGGVIPSNISQCRELRLLDLMQNEISGEIPEQIGLLTNLQVLNLARNHFSGSIPSTISNISSLYDLNLGTNSLGGSIPNDLARLRNLRILDLTINNLTGTVPASIYNMSSLVYLALASNNLWGDLPYNVGDTLPNLRGFNFCINKFTGRIPGSLQNLTNIQMIRMAHNFLHGPVPPGLGNLPDLEMYNIGYNRIVNSGQNGLSFLESLANSTKLNFLAIDYNLLEGEIPESIGNLSKNLKILYMGGNHFHGSIPSSIGSLSSLALLDLGNSSISGEIPQEIGQLKEMQVLGLAGNRLSGKIPDSLGNLHKLSKLDLSGNLLVGRIPSTFTNLQKLLSMDLSDNNLNGSIPPGILNLPSLSAFLNLSRNELTGPLPREVGLLTGVVTINISDNLLSGQIPNSIGDCKSLEHLFLANNLFSGKIPDALGAVNGLETLDLSSNQLSGEIPVSLQRLQALQLLNLSFNNLEGGVPETGVFSNSSKVHLEGNPNLCFHLACKTNSSHFRRWLIVGVVIAIALVSSTLLVVGLLFYLRKSERNPKAAYKSFRQEHRIITYDELRLATNNFSNENLLGNGSFGSVYLGKLGEGIQAAVKILDTTIAGSWKSFSAECEALKTVRHRNLVKLITTCSSIDFRNMEFLALIYEFMSNGSLEDWLTGRRIANGSGLNVFDRLNVVIDVACALDYLHHDCEIPVVHCDIKPGNVLLDSDMTAKVGDFGLAKLLIERNGDQNSISSTHALKGSIGYIPPEYGLGEKPSTKGDVYSFGILLLEVFTGKAPTHEKFVGGLSLKSWVEMSFPNNIDQVLDYKLLLQENITANEKQFVGTEMVDDCFLNIIRIGLSCVADSPDGRITMKEALFSLKNIKRALLKLKL